MLIANEYPYIKCPMHIHICVNIYIKISNQNTLDKSLVWLYAKRSWRARKLGISKQQQQQRHPIPSSVDGYLDLAEISEKIRCLKYVIEIYKQNTRSKDSLNRSQYTNTALLDTTP